MKETITENEFEQAYRQVRLKEGWIMPDALVQQLPEVSRDHPLWKEWTLRKGSTGRLLHYLRTHPEKKRILEVGCGNGWLSNWMSTLPGVTVTGLDIHPGEIAQAKRVFGERASLQFVQGELQALIDAGNRFDLVLFAASIQYFPVFSTIVGQALSCLLPGGELHIMDSPFYEASELEEARRRSQLYFERQDALSMIPFYHHHSFASLRPFRYRILYHPGSVFNRLLPGRNPFYWICIQPKKYI